MDLRESSPRVFREHRNKDVNNNLDLRLVCGGTFDEDITSLSRNFGMVSVNDGG